MIWGEFELVVAAGENVVDELLVWRCEPFVGDVWLFGVGSERVGVCK